MLEKCDDASDWLDDQGPKTSYKEYQSRSYELMGDFNKLKIRKEEHKLREGKLVQILEAANKVKDEMNDIVVKKPWITEEEASDVTDKVDEFLGKVAGLVQEQEEAGLMVEPTFKVQKV